MNRIDPPRGRGLLSSHRAGALLALACAALLGACDAPPYHGPSRLGALDTNVSPESAEVRVSGPGGFTASYTGSRVLDGLEPGTYTVSASAAGFDGAAHSSDVVAGETSSLELFLKAAGTSPSAGAPEGDLVPAR